MRLWSNLKAVMRFNASSLAVLLGGVERRHQCFLHRPTMLQSLPKCLVTNTYPFGPFAYAQCLAAKLQQAIRASITSLLFAGDPSAVRWLVIPAVVDSVKFMLWRGARTHVGVECNERIPPPFADRDPSAAIEAKCLMVRVGATFQHPAPNPELGGLPHSVNAESTIGGRRGNGKLHVSLRLLRSGHGTGQLSLLPSP